jgi:hypothetical protein
MQFTEVLAKHKFTEEMVSHGLKVKIKRYKKLFDAVAEAKIKLSTVKGKVAIENLEKDIREGEENLVALNEEICNGIDNYAANYELNLRKAENLKNKVRPAKGKVKEGEQPEKTEEEIVEQKEPAQLEIDEEKLKKQKEEEEAQRQQQPAPKVDLGANEPPKKKKNIWGIVGGIVLVGLLGAAGYAYHKNKNAD